MIAGFRNSLANLSLSLLPSTSAFDAKRRILRLLGFRIGAGTRIAGKTTFHGAGIVDIRSDCWIGVNVTFYTIPGTTIVIEDRCDIAPNAIIHSGTHLLGRSDRRAGELHGEDILIGQGSWVGVGGIVCAGAEIGAGCIVAAGAVVPKGIYRANTMLAGVPALEVRDLPPD